MMKNETYPTDAGKSHNGVSQQLRHGQWSLTLLAGLVLVAISGPAVWATVSDTTGLINGMAPTATGALNVMFPGGTTTVTNNAAVGTDMKPIDFGVSASALTLQDADGDTGLSSSLNTAAVIWVWKYNNIALTPAQLVVPFSTNFLGKTLTVAASAPVTVSSLTGAPTTNGPQPLTSATSSLVVPASPPVVRVNGVSFALDAGFPKTGFSQATFQFWMNGTSASGNSNYTFAADPLAPWVTVGQTTGMVTFNSEPTVRQTVNINIRDSRTGAIIPYAFTVTTWFVNNGSNKMTATQADSYCVGLGASYGVPSYLKMTNAATGATGTRAPDGRLWDEWGSLGVADYTGSGWISNYHWALEPYGTGSSSRYVVFLSVGNMSGYFSASQLYVACSRTL